MTSKIIFQEKKETGIIYLNRPDSLNALDLEMVNLFLSKLNEWENNNCIKRVLLKGNGKAFCAGGDVKSVYKSSESSNLKKKFFFNEYHLNYKINNFSKPYLSIWNGIVMGGGVGLSIYGNYRIATENTKFAMPETAIGFFPDVGASFFLSRMQKNVGLYLGLTGNFVSKSDLIFLNLATHYCDSNNIENFENNYINEGLLPKSNQNNIKNSTIIENLNFINEVFNGDIFFIMNNLKKQKSEFAKKTYKQLVLRCPMSLAITTELLYRAKKLSLKDCLEMEFQLSQKVVYRDDFNNGVNSVLVTKDQRPKWNPKTLDLITKKEIINLFQKSQQGLSL